MSVGDTRIGVVPPLNSEDAEGPDREDESDESDESDVIDVSQDAPSEPVRKSRRRRLRLRFGRAGTGVWVGLVITVAGFGLIAFTWGKTAALLDVAQQIPYLVSGGLVGLGLILVGLLVINLSVKRREALDRQRQLEELREAMVGLRASIEGEGEDEP